ncbi:MAG: protein serine/threonine phosphatase [Bacteroidetes bacterium]|jgi:serine phosphatase RsbU (regulator of sigma subunit)|nr:protein serine/threonine phosphatase [Bacteroidota bacterium]
MSLKAPITLLLILACVILSAQKTVVDSLENSLRKTRHDTSKARTLLVLSRYLYGKDGRRALDRSKEALLISLAEKNNDLIHDSYIQVGSSFSSISQSDSAIRYFERALEIAQKQNNLYRLGRCYNNLGNEYYTLGNLKKTLDCYLNAAKMSEKADHKVGLCNIYNNIGLVNVDLHNYKAAFDYYTKAREIAETLKDVQLITMVLTNTAEMYVLTNRPDTALVLLARGLRFAEEQGDLIAMANLNNGMGRMYRSLKKFDEAEKHFERSIKYSLEAGDELTSALTYNSLSIVYRAKKQFDRALEMINKAMVIAEKYRALEAQLVIYGNKAEVMFEKGDYKQAYECERKYVELNDSLMNSNGLEQLNELQAKYDSEKRENEIKLLNKENELNETELNKQKQRLWFLVIVVGLVTLIALFVYRNYKEKQKANHLLESKNSEIKQQKELVEKQKEIVEEKQKEIVDSINYAKRIQHTLLANDQLLKKHLPEYFILFDPKDIVSGDFYWAAEAERSSLQGQHDYKQSAIDHKLFYLAVCDSTGHGVPGAFMSLLNIGFLSEAINEKGIHEPHKVFDYARTRLSDSISREGQRDGFDGILLEIIKKENGITLNYASANNLPVLISNGRMRDLKKDKMPVGRSENESPFSLYSVDVEKGDTLYLYTDGYADQFGGSKGKKFKYRQLNDLLLEINREPMAEQKRILKQKFTEWKGPLEQVDDVCIIGIRF